MVCVKKKKKISLPFGMELEVSKSSVDGSCFLENNADVFSCLGNLLPGVGYLTPVISSFWEISFTAAVSSASCIKKLKSEAASPSYGSKVNARGQSTQPYGHPVLRLRGVQVL